MYLHKHEGFITTWHKRQILAGTDWTKVIDSQLSTASVILLLISADFVACNYCYGTEMQRALQRHDAGEARVIPILLRPVDWQGTPFAKLTALPSNGKPISQWRDRDAAFVDVAQGIRKALQDVQRLTVSTSSTSFPRVWNIPYRRNLVFTGREEVLTQLADALKTGQPGGARAPLALSGLGGIGKTQIAVEYAYRFHQHYQAVLWTLAETRESLVSGYVAIAERLNLPQKDEQDQAITVQAVVHWLKMHSEWLLILDNADDLSIVREFLPSAVGGHILLTTRAQAMGGLVHKIEVEEMGPEQGALLLQRRAGLVGPDASLPTDTALAIEISHELGGLPLALDQAGAYIEETQCSLSQYLQHYRIRRAVLLKRRGGLMADHPESVATTWSLSFEKVEQQSLAAADLLRLCAFLSPDAIPEEIITKGAAYLGPWLSAVTENPWLFDEVIVALGAYSLVHRSARDNSLSVHRLVQVVLKESMDEETRQLWIGRAVQAVNEVFPDVDFPTLTQCQRYLPHAQRCALLLQEQQLSLPEAIGLFRRVGWYLGEHARYAEAEPLLEQAQALVEQMLEENDPQATSVIATLGWLYSREGKYKQAEPLLQRALDIREQYLGPSHPHTSISRNQLALLLIEQGKYREAELHLQHTLSIDEQAHGASHPDVATDLNHLASLYKHQREHSQAELLCNRALQIREQQLGPQHPLVATSLSDLASLYRVQDKYKQAEPLYNRARHIWEQALGPEHPNVAYSLTNLAILYREQDKYEEAQPLYVSALAIYEQQLGPHHPQTRAIRRHYASLLRAMGREAEAIQEETRDQVATPTSW